MPLDSSREVNTFSSEMNVFNVDSRGELEPPRAPMSWPKVAWLYLMLVPTVLLGPAALSLETAAVGASLAGLTLLLGHSVGLHRGIIHRAYRTSRPLRNVLAYLFVLTGMGGPLSWIRVHTIRDHHQNRRGGPALYAYDHGMLRDYHWNLHARVVDERDPLSRLPPELERDPWLGFLERTWPMHTALVAAGLFLLGGWPYVIVGVCARVSLSLLGHWFVGFVAHKVGYLRYRIEDAGEEGRNCYFLGLLSFGEGFHNNHHAYPRSARMGHAWYELDLGWLAIRALRALGLVWDVLEAEPSTKKRGARQTALRLSVRS